MSIVASLILNIENKAIQNLLLNYQKEINRVDFINAKNTFQLVNETIKEATDLVTAEKLYCKISLLQATPGGMLEVTEHVINEDGKNLFQKVSDRYDQYNRRYWLKIDKDILSEIDEKYLKDTNNVADEMIKLFERVFKYYLRPSNLKNPPDNVFNVTSEKLPSLVSEALKTIERSERKLNPIMPRFLFLAAEKAAERAKASEEKVRIIEKAVKEVGTTVGIIKKSRRFHWTAWWHFAKGLLSLGTCFLLGYLTIAWVFGFNKILWFDNFFISQNMECSNYIQSNLYLCQLATLSKQLLVGAVLLTGIYASLRSSSANANSDAINRHRYNALQAYTYFHEVVEEKDKSLVLQKATEAIFEHIPTGFNKHHKEDSKSSDTSAQLVHIMDSLVKKIPPTGGGG